MTRRQAANKIFNYIKKNKFEPINIQYGNGYFIFDKGEDGVVHFDIKGLFGWKFAMWLDTHAESLKDENSGKEYPAIQFFCQHKLNIDKFKPSRSFFLEEFSLEEVLSDNTYMFVGIIDMLKMIKRHPLVAFSMDACSDKYHNKSYLSYYIEARIYNTKQKTKEWWNDIFVKLWHAPKIWFVKKYKVVDKVRLVDKNDGYWKISPRYDMRIHFKVISNDEEKQQNAENQSIG